MYSKSTHFFFDGKKILISPDLTPIVTFLQFIEEEIGTVLNYNERLKAIRKQYSETLDLIKVLASKLKENSINFKFTFSEKPSTFVNKLNFNRPVRSEMIIIFAQLEVLLCLSIAYNNKSSDEKLIRSNALKKEVIEAFLKNFCLNPKNEWSKANEERARRITPGDLRKLRNSLTHFFSTGKELAISYPGKDKLTRKTEKETNFKVKFLSPEDLWKIARGAGVLLIKQWSNDYKKSLSANSDDFKQRVLSVKDVIEKHGAIIMTSKLQAF